MKECTDCRRRRQQRMFPPLNGYPTKVCIDCVWKRRKDAETERLAKGRHPEPALHVSARKIDSNGYAFVRINNRWVPEHRFELEKKIGRPLGKGESVHHINGVRHDNRHENLELWVGGIRYGQRASDIKCHHCGEPYRV